jgi:hypothetical protein
MSQGLSKTMSTLLLPWRVSLVPLGVFEEETRYETSHDDEKRQHTRELCPCGGLCEHRNHVRLLSDFPFVSPKQANCNEK